MALTEIYISGSEGYETVKGETTMIWVSESHISHTHRIPLLLITQSSYATGRNSRWCSGPQYRLYIYRQGRNLNLIEVLICTLNFAAFYFWIFWLYLLYFDEMRSVIHTCTHLKNHSAVTRIDYRGFDWKVLSASVEP